jgi:hypothetical protein
MWNLFKVTLLIGVLGCASLGVDIRAEVRDREPTCEDYEPMKDAIDARWTHLEGIYDQTNSFVEGQILLHEMAALVELAIAVQEWHNVNCSET